MNKFLLYGLLICLAVPLVSTLVTIALVLFGRPEQISESSTSIRFQKQMKAMDKLWETLPNPWKKEQDQYRQLASMVGELREDEEE